MKIEAGKYYVTRGGDVVGPLRYPRIIGGYAWVCPLQYGTITVYDDGRYRKDGVDHPNDLIKEHVMPKFKVGDRVVGEGKAGSVIRIMDDIDVMLDLGGLCRFKPYALEAEIIPQPLPSLDLTKPVQTRDGRKVRVLCTDGPGSRPVIGIIDGNKGPSTWCLNGATSEGWFNPDLESESALINTPATPRTFERWFNVYDTGEITSHVDRHDADDEIPWQTRTGRKRVVFTEGEWDE